MYDENAQFDLIWAPVRYPGIDPTQRGRWNVVNDGDAPVAVVWTNGSDAAGISWLQQTDRVVEIHKHFLNAAAAGVNANDAFVAATEKFSDMLGELQTGDLSGVDDDMNDIIQEFNQAR